MKHICYSRPVMPQEREWERNPAVDGPQELVGAEVR